MSNTSVILSIDQGTTSSRTLVFTKDGQLLFTAQQSFTQLYPQDGWVEHNPEDIWRTVLKTLQEAEKYCKDKGLNILAAGVTNQRETTVLWDRKSGKPVYNAIVWQDRRTADQCAKLKSAGHEAMIREKTGLLLDPYFSASKIAWILDNVKGARRKAEAGELAFGTIDSFLIWRLTGGKSHASDATNASRTSLFNINTAQWDDALLSVFNVPNSLLPDVKDCAANYGAISDDIIAGNVHILGVAGDQQAALIGQGCFAKGELKSTYGTGCFIVTNTGAEIIRSKNNLLSTIGYQLNGEVTYALEGSIFVAGAAVQWLRDGLELFSDTKETAELARSAENNPELYLVPAFTGLGAPYWDPHARGALFGLTRAANRADLVRAAIEGIAFQTYDLLSAMDGDGITPKTLRVDGGMAANDWFLQTLANITHVNVERPDMLETTALGAARLALMSLEPDYMPKTGTKNPVKDDNYTRTKANWPAKHRDTRIKSWERAIRATQVFSSK